MKLGIGINPQVQIDAAREIAMACAQRTVPLCANCALLASSVLNQELKQQQMHGQGNGQLMEGLAYVRRMLYHGTQARYNQGNDKNDAMAMDSSGDGQMGDDAQVAMAGGDVVSEQLQWHACWILNRLAIEAKRRIGANSQKQLSKEGQKPNSEHETDEDFKAYPARVFGLLRLCKSALVEFAAQVEQPLSQSQQQWSKRQLAQAVLDATAELAGVACCGIDD